MLQTPAPIGALLGGNLGPCALVDVETTGFAAADHRVLSITVITVEPNGEISGEFHTLVDPRCDPGPVHIHGLTREKLSGAPQFELIQPRLSDLLRGRLLIAHNAEFDYDFIDEEFQRCGAELPVAQRLCTVALARRVAPPTPDCRLVSLAAYYSVPQLRAHDSLDDTRVLAGVLRGLLADADRIGVEAPILSCPPTRGSGASKFPRPRSRPKQPCAFANPGRFEMGNPLVQGMKVAITGETRTDRYVLTERAEAAGLHVVSSVSRQTSVLVTNEPLHRSRKGRSATEHATPVVDEALFLTLLDRVHPGTAKAIPKAPGRSKSRSATPAPAPSGPLSGRRILVLGGTHDAAAQARTRIAELGGSAAVNMSGSVTDILALSDSATDPRHRKAAALGLQVHGPEMLHPERSADPAPEPAGTPVVTAPIVLSHGQVIDLPIADLGTEWTFRASWTQTTTCEVDLVAFLLDDEERVAGDEDFVFFNQPNALGAQLSADGPNEQAVTLRLDALPDHCRRIVIAAAIDGDAITFGEVGAIELDATPGLQAATVARATLDAATTEQTLRLAEIYLRGETWRLRSVGQGYETGLAELAAGFGVEVDD